LNIWEECIDMRYNKKKPLEEIWNYYKSKTGRSTKFTSFKTRLSSEKTKKGAHHVVGVIGDFHAPFNHPNYLNFCKKTFDKYGVNEIVMIGDLVDNHAVSRHQTEVDADGGYSEYTRAKETVEKFLEMFPSGKLTIGNHDRIPQRQAATLGLHDGFIKSFAEVWELPETWKVAPSFIIDDVLYTHGLATGGVNGTLLTAMKRGTSMVAGHKHSCSGVRYAYNGNKTIFAMDTGCGIDSEKYAFRYGKDMINQPVLSCGIVIDGKEAYVIPMID